MGGSDFYCSVSGARYFSSSEEFCDEIFWSDNYETGRIQVKDVSEVVKSSLRYSIVDVRSSSKFIMIAQYDFLKDGSILLHADMDYLSFQYDPQQGAEYGEYVNEDPNAPNDEYTVIGIGCTLSLSKPRRGSSPKLWSYCQYANWLAVCGHDRDEPRAFWNELLTQKDKTDEEILHDAWRGPGNMWVFVRPDRFPIAKTLAAEPLPSFPCQWNRKSDDNAYQSPLLETLSLDILLTICKSLPIRSIYALITTCKRLRQLILPHADLISRHRLLEDEPWYLPAGPFDLRDKKHGREEIDWWNAQWATGGILETT